MTEKEHEREMQSIERKIDFLNMQIEWKIKDRLWIEKEIGHLKEMVRCHDRLLKAYSASLKTGGNDSG